MVVNPLPDFSLPSELTDILQSCPNFTLAADVEQLIELAVKDAKNGYHEVAYDIPNRGKVVEALVCRVRNGISANYTEPYMRRRDPDCMVIGDDLPTNKPTFKSRFGFEFEELRQQTFAWLKTQELALFTFVAGVKGKGPDVVVVAPANAGFFALGLSLLQGIDDPSEIGSDFLPGAVLYVAPPFRHQVFQGKQVVVHNRRPGLHELFSYNLYPGPSAKKGIYGVLLAMGEQENWVTAHASTVQVITPYDNKVTFMHEGASGGGKSEMLEPAHRRPDGSLLLGKNLVTGDERHLILPKTCDLRPVTDDMALCHPSLRQPKNQDKLALMDAENAWFVRLNHITHYGTDPYLEELTIHPPHPLLFLNIEARPESTALIWQHIEDEPGKPCPNPRVVIPRDIIPNVVNGAVSVDIRSFGVRTPPCTKERPSYGIIGLLHLLPPALAWLWRLVAPRGHANPSIVEKEGMSSEGVGSYWPFATGRRVIQANLILQQILTTPKVRYTLCPNQYIGAWEVGFMAQWIAREYLARRGGEKFSRQQVVPSRCPLLGYTFRSMMVEGQTIGNWFFRVNLQPEVGNEAFDWGTTILKEFFAGQLRQFLEPDLDPLGKTIIDCCLSDASLEDYERLIPYPIISDED
ncbi:DUF4914 domain-containing protein [Microcystis aeruginosa KW]|jgi:hypothetical protein|uniref:DUF4914 domain-containing protein n=1 Tax=Microcystis aeruginosa KW TaxID=1960155 RepID=A0A1V4BNQ9_MICAE|nr:DUF4914 family protein [Microcystis aeruginosa]OPF15674.1 DUF4914 domain-containing protein [Microcystis aeruginosa KW]